MKIHYTQPENELAPDLEWMLSSHQVSSGLLLDTLVHEYYTQVYRLAFSILDDPQAAGQAVKDTFTAVLLNVHHYRAAAGVENWIYKIAWNVCKKSYRREKRWNWLEKLLSLHGELTYSNQTNPDNVFEAEVWQAVDELADHARFIFILKFFHGWTIEMISLVTGIATRQVESSLEVAIQQITRKLEGNSQAIENIGVQVSVALGNRWPVPEINNDELNQLVLQVEKQAHRGNIIRVPYVTLGEMALIIAAVIMVLGLAWWGNQVLDGHSPPKQDVPIPSPTYIIRSQDTRNDNMFLMPHEYSSSPMMTSASTIETPEGVFFIGPAGNSLEVVANRLGITVEELRRINVISGDVHRYQGQWLWVPTHLIEVGAKVAAPVPPISYTLPMRVPKIAQDLNLLLYPSEPTYNTVWVDALISIHQETGSDSPPQELRVQLWLSGNKGLLLGGPSDQAPSEVMLWIGDEEYVAKPGSNEPIFKYTGAQIDPPPISFPLLYGMLMMLKSTVIWDSPNLIYIEPGSFAGRETWIVEAANSQNEPVALIHLDRKTGFVLHDQELKKTSGPLASNLVLPDEVTVRKINFDVNIPNDLFDPNFSWIGGYASNYTGQLAPHN